MIIDPLARNLRKGRILDVSQECNPEVKNEENVKVVVVAVERI